MENFKSFFKKGEDSEKLKKVINEAVETESKKLEYGVDQDFKENVEDQEYNILAYKHFVENILGKKVEGFDFKEGDVKKIEGYMKSRNDYIMDRIHEIYEYIQKNSGSLSIEEYQEKLERLLKIETRIKELNRKMVGELFHNEHLNNKGLYEYSESLDAYDQELRKLELDKKELQEEIEDGIPKIDPEEEEKLNNESDELNKESQKLQKYLHVDPSQN